MNSAGVCRPRTPRLSEGLFVLYTNKCQSKYAHRHIIKFTDDSVIASLLNNDDPDHGPVLSDFTDWFKASFLPFNVSKTKEMTLFLIIKTS